MIAHMPIVSIDGWDEWVAADLELSIVHYVPVDHFMNGLWLLKPVY